MFNFIRNIFSSNDSTIQNNSSQIPKPTGEPIKDFANNMINFNNLVKEQPIISEQEFNSLMDKVQQTERALSDRTERAKVVRYLDHLTEIKQKETRDRIKNGDKSIPGIMQIVAYGPSCWNGGLRTYHQNNLVCWYCGGRHE
jgi:hypothetical protein